MGGWGRGDRQALIGENLTGTEFNQIGLDREQIVLAPGILAAGPDIGVEGTADE